MFKLSESKPQTEDRQRTGVWDEERSQASSRLPTLTPSKTPAFYPPILQPNNTPSMTPANPTPLQSADPWNTPIIEDGGSTRTFLTTAKSQPILRPKNTPGMGPANTRSHQVADPWDAPTTGGSTRTMVRTAKSLDGWPLARQDTSNDWDPDLDVHRYRGGRLSMNGRIKGGADILSSPWFVGRRKTPSSRGSQGSNIRSPSAPPLLAVTNSPSRAGDEALPASGLESMPEGSNRHSPPLRWGSSSRRISQLSRGSTRGSLGTPSTPGQNLNLKRRIRTLPTSSAELNVSEQHSIGAGLGLEDSFMNHGSIEQSGLLASPNPLQGGWRAPGARDNTITGVPNFRSYRHQWISGKTADSRVDGALLHAELISQKLNAAADADAAFLVPLSSDEMTRITEAGAKVKVPPKWTRYDKGEGERTCFSPQPASPWD